MTEPIFVAGSLPQNAVLLVVDVQKGMDVYAERYNRNNPSEFSTVIDTHTVLAAL